VDPIAINFPWNSPFAYCEGDPINYEDLDGLQTPTARNAIRPRATRPTLSNTVVDRNGRIVTAPIGPSNPPITPPNGGVSRGQGGWIVETPNGGFFVPDENPFGPQPPAPKLDFRRQIDKDIEAASVAFQYFLRDINIEKPTPIRSSLNIITTDPSRLPDWYLQDVRTRLINGKGSFNDWMYRDELVKRGIIAPRFGQGQEYGRPASSDVLGKNLERAGDVRLTIRDAAHHIVAGTDRRAAGARAILSREGIDINDASNGVFLDINSHSRIHTSEYFRKIENRLKQAGSGNVRKELEKIKSEIKNGTF
jgi:hypothetical protein